MNILILSNATATTLIAAQTGQHRLGPVPLTDGRYFLSVDVLVDHQLFAQQMVGVNYEESTLEDVRHLIPTGDDGLFA